MSDTTATFTDFGVEEVLANALRSKGIIHPFPIQELTLPMALKGADLIGQARTGTGKTLAFGLPLLQRVDPDLKKTQALVIVPTRELCLQVADDLTVGASRGVTSIAIYGGVGYDEQIEALTGGVHVVIGTPGRTLDHLGRGNLDLSNVHTVVLDEADEMLDMGFLPDVERLLTEVPRGAPDAAVLGDDAGGDRQARPPLHVQADLHARRGRGAPDGHRPSTSTSSSSTAWTSRGCSHASCSPTTAAAPSSSRAPRTWPTGSCASSRT